MGTAEVSAHIVPDNPCVDEEVCGMEQHDAMHEELNEAKRIVALINTSLDEDSERENKAAGLGILKIRHFGCLSAQLGILTALKRRIRLGRVVWIQAEARPVHHARPTWITQVCRQAHRACAQWTIRFTASP